MSANCSSDVSESRAVIASRRVGVREERARSGRISGADGRVRGGARASRRSAASGTRTHEQGLADHELTEEATQALCRHFGGPERDASVEADGDASAGMVAAPCTVIAGTKPAPRSGRKRGSNGEPAAG